MNKGLPCNQDNTVVPRAKYKSSLEIFGVQERRVKKLETDTEVVGVRDGAKTKLDVNAKAIMRKFLESVPRGSKGSGISRLQLLTERLYDLGMYGKGYAAIEAIKILLDRSYGKPIEHVEVKGNGLMTGLVININGVTPNPDSNEPIPIVEIKETKNPKRAKLPQNENGLNLE